MFVSKIKNDRKKPNQSSNKKSQALADAMIKTEGHYMITTIRKSVETYKLFLCIRYPDQFSLPKDREVRQKIETIVRDLDQEEHIPYGRLYLYELAHLLHYIKTGAYLPCFSSEIPIKYIMDIIVYYDPENLYGIRRAFNEKGIYNSLKAAIETHRTYRMDDIYCGAYPGCRANIGLGAFCELTANRRSPSDLKLATYLKSSILDTIKAVLAYMKLAAENDMITARQVYGLEKLVGSEERRGLLSDINATHGTPKGVVMINLLNKYTEAAIKLSQYHRISFGDERTSYRSLMLSTMPDLINHFHPIITSIFASFFSNEMIMKAFGSETVPMYDIEIDHEYWPTDYMYYQQGTYDEVCHEWDYYNRACKSKAFDYDEVFWSLAKNATTQVEISHLFARELNADFEWEETCSRDEIISYCKNTLSSGKWSGVARAIAGNQDRLSDKEQDVLSGIRNACALANVELRQIIPGIIHETIPVQERSSILRSAPDY